MSHGRISPIIAHYVQNQSKLFCLKWVRVDFHHIDLQSIPHNILMKIFSYTIFQANVKIILIRFAKSKQWNKWLHIFSNQL